MTARPLTGKVTAVFKKRGCCWLPSSPCLAQLCVCHGNITLCPPEQLSQAGAGCLSWPGGAAGTCRISRIHLSPLFPSIPLYFLVDPTGGRVQGPGTCSFPAPAPPPPCQLPVCLAALGLQRCYQCWGKGLCSKCRSSGVQ